MDYDLIIIGGGPGGYVAAIRAAQRGLEVALIEKNKLGGTCLNVGCIPTKSFIESVSVIDEIEKRKGSILNINSSYSLNYDSIMAEKNKIVNKLTSGVESLLINQGVKIFKGIGSFISDNSIEIKMDKEIKKITGSKIILATGSQPMILPGFNFESEKIINSTEALNLKEVPQDLLIIGGGVIGVEFANIFCNLNSNVSILEMEENLLPNEDKEASEALLNSFKSKGINVFTKAKANNWEKNNTRARVSFEHDNTEKIIDVDKVLVSIGREPVMGNIGLDNLGLKYNDNGVEVNQYLKTSKDHIYAVGDLIGNYKYAHVAFQEGIVAAENLLGSNKKVNYRNVPRCIYTRPEIAGVGLTESEGRKKFGNNLKVGKYPYSFNGKALSEKEDGFVKVIVEPEYNQIVGGVIFGAHATELISQLTIITSLDLTVETFDDIIIPHPTISEALKESVLGAIEMAIHM